MWKFGSNKNAQNPDSWVGFNYCRSSSVTPFFFSSILNVKSQVDSVEGDMSDPTPPLTVYLASNIFEKYWLHYGSLVGTVSGSWWGHGILRVYREGILIAEIPVYFSRWGREDPILVQVPTSGYYKFDIAVTDYTFPDDWWLVRVPYISLNVYKYYHLSLAIGPVVAIVGIIIAVFDYVRTRKSAKT